MAEYREDDDYLLDGDDDDDDYEMTRRRPGAEDLDLVDIIGEDEEADKQMKILDQDLGLFNLIFYCLQAVLI